MKKVVISLARMTAVLALCAGLSAPALFADPPICNPFCITSQCSHHSQCTAEPNGKCNFACPGVGCCVYG